MIGFTERRSGELCKTLKVEFSMTPSDIGLCFLGRLAEKEPAYEYTMKKLADIMHKATATHIIKEAKQYLKEVGMDYHSVIQEDYAEELQDGMLFDVMSMIMDDKLLGPAYEMDLPLTEADL